LNKNVLIPIVEEKVTYEQAASTFVNPLTIIGMYDVVKKANVEVVI